MHMILIIGGAYQGKMTFAEQLLKEQKKNGKAGSIFPQFHMWVKAHMKADANDRINENVNSNEKNDKLEKELREKLAQEPDMIIVSNELGGGVVPMDAFDRAWRERTGRLTCALAVQAEAVYRVTCGIGTRIK